MLDISDILVYTCRAARAGLPAGFDRLIGGMVTKRELHPRSDSMEGATQLIPLLRILTPPGRYSDGPVYVRVNKAIAGSSWPAAYFRSQIDQFRFKADPEHDYIEADNSHSAFVYCNWMRDMQVPAEALTVARLVRARPGSTFAG